jgi:HPr Serine kinase C-terminal domain
MGGAPDVQLAFTLAGLPLRVATDDRSVADLVADRFRSLPRLVGEGSGGVDVRLRGPGVVDGPPPRPPGEGRTVYDAPTAPVEYFDGVDRLFLELPGRVRCLAAPADGWIDVAVTGRGPGDATVAVNPVLTLALIETVKRVGRFSLHAAAVELGGRGVLVAGPSGVGKSTLTVALVRAGAGFLSDDTVFLTRAAGGGLEVHGLPDDIDVTDTTISLVPELASVGRQPVPDGRQKRSFGADDQFGARPVATCRPAVLLSPRVTPGAEPTLEPLGAPEVLAELAPNVLLTEPAAAQAHLDALGDLVAAVPRYRFHYGEDLAAAADCVRRLVDP